MVNIIIVDDQQIVREGLKMILSLHEEVKVIGEASNGEKALELLTYTSPEVVLMDIPDIKVIILTTFNDREYIFTGLKNGADGYILKDSGSQEIISSIKTACEGNILLNPKITREVVNALNVVNYTGTEHMHDERILQLLMPRELEVARRIMEGKSNKEISSELFITEGTVKNYVSRMLEKLELKNRTELTLCLQKSL